MDNRALIIAAIIALVIIIAVSLINYTARGWNSFLCDNGQTCSWSADAVEDLRFRDVTFSVQLPNGESYSKDVTPVLNSMAVAYEGVKNSGSLSLDRPLNPFSFLIPGVNDSKTVPDPTQGGWPNAVARLIGKTRNL